MTSTQVNEQIAAIRKVTAEACKSKASAKKFLEDAGIIKKYKYYIGIDCGVNTGYSVYDKPQKKLLQVCSMNIIQAMQAVSVVAMNNPDELFVRIEDPRLRKWIPKQKDEKAERGRNRGAGSVMRDAQIWQDFLNMEKIPYELVAPKNNKTKTSAEYFKKVTGWQLGTNEHGRDAAMLVYGC